MGGLSWVHWLIVIAVVALLFGGGGKLSGLRGDAAKGIRAFRDGLKGDEAKDDKPSVAAPLPPAPEKQDEPIVR